MTYCACRCGSKTTIYRGEPRKFLKGHAPRGEPPLTEAHRAYLKAFDAWLHSGQSDVRYRSMMDSLLRDMTNTVERAQREYVNGEIEVDELECRLERALVSE